MPPTLAFIGRRSRPLVLPAQVTPVAKSPFLLTSRETASDIAYRALCPDQFSGTRERFACVAPIALPLKGLPSPLDVIAQQWEDGPWRLSPVITELSVRCRKCENCLKHRKRLWAARAIDEVNASNRTWFGTLTVNPAERFRCQLLAEQWLLSRGHGAWSKQEPDNKFKALVKVLGAEITKWLKRVRKASGAPLRYLLVSEAHKDGFPHFHLLIHEQALPVTERTLRRQWRLGFSQFVLVDREAPKAAGYVCKYLTKDALTRVRGSVRYGRAHLVARSTERMLSATRSMSGMGRKPWPVTSHE